MSAHFENGRKLDGKKPLQELYAKEYQLEEPRELRLGFHETPLRIEIIVHKS